MEVLSLPDAIATLCSLDWTLQRAFSSTLIRIASIALRHPVCIPTHGSPTPLSHIGPRIQ